MRESGILCPIFTLPSKFGIGSLSKEAFEFVDFLEDAAQGYWQILPVGPTGYGDSPYQSVCAFAGNPYFISLEDLIEEGLLSWDDCWSLDFGKDETKVDYGALYNNRFVALQKAFDCFIEKKLYASKDYQAFVKKESYWLEDYCLFMAIKQANKGANWTTWPDDLKRRNPITLKKVRKDLEHEIQFFSFIQFKFKEQWDKLHAYAKDKNVKIIGDIPFYTALDSVDVWVHPEVFLMDKDLNPTMVAGCAPDDANPDGQLWGNPIYNWKALKENDYDWWMRRFEKCFELFDVVRIDHFHGFTNYYGIPFVDKTAENGKSYKGPGMDFFHVFEKKFGKLDDMKIIAEDLGTLTKENVQLLKDTGIPGMKILQYAFTSWDSVYMPYKYMNNCVVYTGTHDNMPTAAWLDAILPAEREFVRKYVNCPWDDTGALTWDMIRECYKSVSNLCIIPLHDYLVKGKEARINVPGGASGNWQFRIPPHFLSKELSNSIRELVQIYGRMPKSKP